MGGGIRGGGGGILGSWVSRLRGEFGRSACEWRCGERRLRI